MSHLDELTLMMYLDGELSGEESRQVETHLVHCPSCRQQCSRFQTDKELFLSVFADASSQPESPLTLNAFTQVQVEAIASLHRRQRQRLAWNVLGWFGVLLASAGSYWLFLQSDWYLWLSQTWTGWRYDFLWTSAFWLKENAEKLLLQPEDGLIQASLLFLLLLAALLLFHSRQASLSPEKYPEGGQHL